MCRMFWNETNLKISGALEEVKDWRFFRCRHRIILPIIYVDHWNQVKIFGPYLEDNLKFLSLWNASIFFQRGSEIAFFCNCFFESRMLVFRLYFQFLFDFFDTSAKFSLELRSQKSQSQLTLETIETGYMF